jgi:hypothetical protein
LFFNHLSFRKTDASCRVNVAPNPDEQRTCIAKVIALMKAREQRQAAAAPAESNDGSQSSGAPGGAPGSPSGAPKEKAG